MLWSRTLIVGAGGGETKQITDLIFDYYILEEIQNISSLSSEFSLIGLFLLLLLLLVGYKAWRGEGLVWLEVSKFINHSIYHCVITIITWSISQDQTAARPSNNRSQSTQLWLQTELSPELVLVFIGMSRHQKIVGIGIHINVQ